MAFGGLQITLADLLMDTMPERSLPISDISDIKDLEIVHNLLKTLET